MEPYFKKRISSISLVFLFVGCIGCGSDSKPSAASEPETKSHTHVVTMNIDGELVTDTIEVDDSTHQAMLDMIESMKTGEFGASSNDTVYNALGQPEIVKLGDSIFGANQVRYKYNDLGQLTEETGYNQQDEISPYQRDIAQTRYKYNNRGNIIEIRKFGDDGNLISSEFEDTPIIKRVYNEEGIQTEEWYLNEYGELRSEFAIAIYEYDQEGKRSLLGWFNQKGEQEPEK
ncbi:MAG: hypothetical protein HRT74_11495 [Flavobacteriales bacterium]|nr:hypothetical protein [Flavobacteriales bacterium]